MPASRTPSTSRTSRQQRDLQVSLSRKKPIRGSSPLPDSTFTKSSKSDNGRCFTIRSSDDVAISVRADILKSYIPELYNDCSSIGDRELELPYSSQALHLIVGFLSRGSFQPPTDTSPYDYLRECFLAAKVYELDSLTTWLRSELSHPRSPYYLGNAPIEAYSLCSTWKFKQEKRLAFQSCIGAIDFSNSAYVASITSKCHTPAIALNLISRLTRRSIIILEVFSAFHTYPLDLRSDIWTDKLILASYDDLTCDSCRDNALFRIPSWVVSWAYLAKAELLGKPGAECTQVFKVEFMSKQRDGYDLFREDQLGEESRDIGSPVCRECLKRILIDNPSGWEDWAEYVEGLLLKKLGEDF